MSDIQDAKKLAAKAVTAEKQLAKMEEQFALQSEEFAKYLKKRDKENKKIKEMWDSVKKTLIDANYFDVIENENFRISVSKVLGVKVVDIDKLPENLTETVKVAKTDKIKKHYELYGELPDGAVDNSFYRLNKKVK